jgi:uncharacterized protein (TIGR02284 family)
MHAGHHISARSWGIKTMAAETMSNQLELIHKLIETCRDGQAGYLEAAEYAHNEELKRFFSTQAMERARFAGELERAAQRLGESSSSVGPSFANKVHRAWIDLKHKLGAGDASVLGSVETGESNAKAHYQQALAAELPPEMRSIIERQAESISMAYSQVCALRTMYKKAA